MLKRLLHRDIVLEHLLKSHDISVLSHTGPLGTRFSFPTIGWIMDFQYKYLPDYFTKDELPIIDKNYETNCAECTRLIFSSNAAKSLNLQQ